jgi:hypothetical protein
MLGASREVIRSQYPLNQPQSFLKTLIILKNDRTMILFTLGCLLSTRGARAFHPVPVAIPAGDPRFQQQTLDTMAALLACNAISVILLQYQIGRLLNRKHLRSLDCRRHRVFIVGLIGFSLADSLVGWCVAMFIFTLGRNDHLPGRLSVRRHPGSGRTARQLLRRAEPGSAGGAA